MPTSIPDKPFEERRRELLEEFLAQEAPTNDDELGKGMIDLIFRIERMRYRAENKPELWSKIDTYTLDKLKKWDTNDPTLLLVEKVFKRFANDNNVAAIKLLKQAVDLREKELSRQQSIRAKTPRAISEIDEAILETLSEHPEITAKQLVKELAKIVGKGLIAQMDEVYIYTKDGRKFKITGLKNKLSILKKKSQ